MNADLEASTGARARAAFMLLGYLLLWASAVLPLAALALKGQLRAVEDDFQRTAAALQREVGAQLKRNAAVLESMAAFVRAGAEEADVLQRYGGELLARFPGLFQFVLSRRADGQHPPLPASHGPENWGGFSADEPSYYPAVMIGPARPQNQAAQRLDAQAGTHLREGLVQALSSAAPAMTRPFGLTDGEMAYALFHPIFDPADARYGEVLAALLVRGRDLLPADRVIPGLRLELRYEEPSAPLPALRLLHYDQRAPSAIGARILPVLRSSVSLDQGGQQLLLIVERQVDWSMFDLYRTAAVALIALGSLVLLLGYGRARIRRVDNERARAQRLYVLANYDTLTGLPNRNLLRDRLEHALARARRRGAAVAVLFLDLDGFKAVNDNAGHDTGDKLLIEVANRLRSCVRSQDTVARLSGDEFVIVLEDVSGRRDAERVMHQIRSCLEEKIEIGEFAFLVSASVGISVYPDDGCDELSLLRKADFEMYSHKHPDWSVPIR